jgi:ABC-2 type transport system ATP-binding protein
MARIDNAIETAGLTKYFGRKKAVDSITLVVPRGSVFALLGRNGSGKTTTIQMLLGFLSPTSGSCSVLGHDSRKITPALRGRVGYMAESHPLHEWMTVKQEGEFASSFHSHWNWDLFKSIVDHFGLSPSAKGKNLSRGQRAGLSLALALAPEPELLILDDPALGLDPIARQVLLGHVMDVARESDRTVLFSSQLVEDVERVADYAAILDYSTLKVAGSIEEITAAIRQVDLSFAPGAMPAIFPPIPGLLATDVSEDTVTLTVSELNEDARTALARLHPISMQERPASFDHAVLSYLRPGGGLPDTSEARSAATARGSKW